MHNSALSLASDPTADIWAKSGLGSAARKVYEALVVEAAETGSAHTGRVGQRVLRSRGQVTRQLLRLQTCGLARKVAAATWVPEVRDAGEVAAQLGVSGLAHARTEKHELERLQHRLSHLKYILTESRNRSPTTDELAVARVRRREAGVLDRFPQSRLSALAG